MYIKNLAKSTVVCAALMGAGPAALAQPEPESAAVEPDEPLGEGADGAPEEMVPEASVTRVLVVPMASKTDKMREAATSITDALSAAAAKSGAAVETSSATREQITALVECKDEAPACMQEMLDAVSADVIILGALVSTEGGWILTVKEVRRGEEDKISTHVLQSDQPALLETQVQELAAKTFGNAPAAVDPDPVLEKPPNPVMEDSSFSLGKVNTAAWAVTGAGVGLAALGATFLVLASGKQGKVDDAPDATLDDINKLRDLEDSADRLELFGNSFLIAGAVTSVVGVTWAVLQARSSSAEAPTALFLAPTPTKGGAMVTLTLFP